MGAIVLNGARIGHGSIIAAGCVIPEGVVVEPFSLWAGVPGKFRKKIDDPETQEMIRQYARNYFGYKEQYLLEMAQPGDKG
jgi:carbonic anhydrase/acetyltransferase-like protein (isoleucine patch superfamily)